MGVDVLPGLEVRIGKEPSGNAITYLSGQRFFVDDAHEHPAVSGRLAELTGARSVLFEPVRRGDEVTAVLTVGWRRRIGDVSAYPASLIGLVADEAAVAIERSDLLSRLAALARTDPLTGLANRRVWDERLPLEIARSRRGGEPLSLLVSTSTASRRSTTGKGTRPATGS